ncbi:MAG: hypothetical protein VYE22_26420 [Myxococcota bacterium]|nr:hypothetical protein [Myxococcota bacterium]
MSSVRRSTAYFVTLIAFAVAAGVGWWWWTGPRAEALAREAAAAHLARWEACLFGEPGLEADAAVARAEGAALRERVAPSEWPERCDPHRASLVEQLRAAGLGADDFAASPAIAWGEDAWRDEVSGLVTAARALELPAAAASEAPALPPAFDAPPPGLELIGADERAFEDAPGVSLVLGAPEGETTRAQVCALRAEGPDLDCGAPFLVEGRASLRPLPRDEGAPVIVYDFLSAAGGEDQGTLRDAAGESLAETVRPAYARADGVIGWRLQQEGKPLLAIHLADAEAETRELEAPFLGAEPVDALMAPGFAAVRWEEPGKRALLHLHPWTERFPSDPEPLEAHGLLRAACALGGARALVWDADGAFVVSIDDAAHRVELRGVRPRCLADAVSFLDEESGALTRCRADGCASAPLAPTPPWDAGWQTASIDLGDDLLHVFHGDGLPTFARRGDGPLHLARLGPMARPLLLPHRGGALLVFRDAEVTRALVLAPDGAPRAPAPSDD